MSVSGKAGSSNIMLFLSLSPLLGSAVSDVYLNVGLILSYF